MLGCRGDILNCYSYGGGQDFSENIVLRLLAVVHDKETCLYGY
jgi:hypothetical protein